MVISNSINTLGPTIDMFWVARLGSDAIASLGVSGIVVAVVISLIFGLFTGTSAIIARFMGAKDAEGANRAAQQAFVVGLGMALLIAVIGIFLSEPILKLLGVSPEVLAEGTRYLRIQLVGMITMTVLQVSQSIMQASGDSLNPLKVSITFRLLQVGLCPLLVFGWGFFPKLGVTGAALSNLITQGLGSALALWILLGGHTRLKVSFKGFQFDPNIIARTVLIGIPSSTTFVLISFTELIMTKFIAAFGTAAIASQMLAQRIDQMIQNLSGGLGTAAGVLGGQNLGARKPERAERTGWFAVAMASGITFCCSIVVWFWIEHILGLFNKDPALISVASTFLRIQIVGYCVWGMVVGFSLFLNGVGDTLIPLLANISTMLGVQVTLAYLLPKHTDLGLYGIRWAVVSGVVIRAVIYLIYFKGGRWKRKRV
jgi:putative MATE family efflux protein